VNNLPRVVRQPRPGRGSNSRPLDRKYDVLRLHHYATLFLLRFNIIEFNNRWHRSLLEAVFVTAGMLVVIVLAMALFVGLLILIAGVLCLTRYDKDSFAIRTRLAHHF